MCDYSLEVYGSRPAREGERYVTTRFPSGSIGLASVANTATAVCTTCQSRRRSFFEWRGSLIAGIPTGRRLCGEAIA